MEKAWKTLNIKVEKRQELAPAADFSVETPSVDYYILRVAILRALYLVVKLITKQCQTVCYFNKKIQLVSVYIRL